LRVMIAAKANRTKASGEAYPEAALRLEGADVLLVVVAELVLVVGEDVDLVVALLPVVEEVELLMVAAVAELVNVDSVLVTVEPVVLESEVLEVDTVAMVLEARVNCWL